MMSHEICHMFGIKHCVYYECLMNGSNHDEEAANKPMNLCPVCLRKLQSNIGFDVLRRYECMLGYVKGREEEFGN